MNSISNKHKSCAIIPFYNEIKSLRNVVEGVRKYTDFIICVNDGSTDGSESTIDNFDELFILENPQNMGKGYSLKRGLLKAAELGYTKLITIDADLQHDPDYIPHLLESLDKYEFVIGNRLENLKVMPPHRIVSNKITSYMLSRKFDQKILDSQCGYRAFNSSIIKSIIPESNGFEAETEMIILALRNNIKIGFIPISTIYGEEKSKMRNLEATIGFLKVYFTK